MILQQFADMEKALKDNHERKCDYWNEILDHAIAELNETKPGSDERREASRIVSAICDLALAE